MLGDLGHRRLDETLPGKHAVDEIIGTPILSVKAAGSTGPKIGVTARALEWFAPHLRPVRMSLSGPIFVSQDIAGQLFRVR